MSNLENYQRIISFLVEARHKLGLTQAQLGSTLGKPQSYVAKYELCERHLDVVEFMDICTALKIRPSKLMVFSQ